MIESNKKLALGWLAYNFGSENYMQGSANLEYVNDQIQFMLREDPLELLRLIHLIYKMDSSESVLPSLAAGPLENLINLNNEEVLLAIIDIAKKDNVMKFLIGGVWFDYSPFNPLHTLLKENAIEMNHKNYAKFIAG